MLTLKFLVRYYPAIFGAIVLVYKCNPLWILLRPSVYAIVAHLQVKQASAKEGLSAL